MTTLKEYIQENLVSEASKKIVGWFGVSYDHGGHIEVLGKVCPRYEGETEEETKLRFIKDRHEQSVEHLKDELKRIQARNDDDDKGTIEMLKKYLSTPFNAEKSLQHYCFW